MRGLHFCLLVLLSCGCKQRYEAPVKLPLTGYLVIEGVVSSGTDTSILKLSRTTKLDNRNVQPEKGALMELRGQDNSVYAFTEKMPANTRQIT